MEKEKQIKGRCKISMSYCKSAPIFRIETLRNDEARSGGFTLIELLVVVLIIGILAAVALPQYQKAVEKSKAAQAFAMIRTVAAAQEAYHLANGTYAKTFDELAVDIPWTGTTRWIAGSSPWQGALSNQDWSIQLYYEGNGYGISVGRISGPYAGAGFVYMLGHVYANDTAVPRNQMLCHENHYVGAGGSQSIVFSKANGDYCMKIFKANGYNFSPLP